MTCILIVYFTVDRFSLSVKISCLLDAWCGEYTQLNYAASPIVCYPMDHNKVGNQSKGGAHRPETASSTATNLLRYKNITSALLCFTCGACFILSLICICLATLVILLNQAVEATNYRYGKNIKNFLLQYVSYNTSLWLILPVFQTPSIRNNNSSCSLWS